MTEAKDKPDHLLSRRRALARIALFGAVLVGGACMASRGVLADLAAYNKGIRAGKRDGFRDGMEDGYEHAYRKSFKETLEQRHYHSYGGGMRLNTCGVTRKVMREDMRRGSV